MRKIIGGLIGLFGAGIIEAIIYYNLLRMEPCSLVPAVTCRDFMGNQYSDFQSFLTDFPVVFADVLGFIVGASVGWMSE
jgi:hypothetical protein